MRGADIVIFNDNDDSGRAHAEAAARMSLGIAARVRRLDLALHWPGMPEHADVSDWLALGHTREELDALIAGAPDWIDGDDRQQQQNVVLTLQEWLVRDLPEPDYILGNWLTTTSRVLLGRADRTRQDDV